MINKDLKYQNPIFINFYRIMDVSKEFGTYVCDVKDRTYTINGNFFYMKNAKIYNLYNIYNIVVGVNENENEVCLVSTKDKDTIIKVLDNGELKYDIFLEINIKLLDDIKMMSVEHVRKLYKDTEKKLDDESFKIDYEDFVDSIDDQLSDTQTGIITQIYTGKHKYTVHNPCNEIYAICKEDKNKTVRFLEKNKLDSFMNSCMEDTVENYWNIINDPMYMKLMEITCKFIMMLNRMRNLEFLLNYNGYSINGKKMTFREKRRFKKFFKNLSKSD